MNHSDAIRATFDRVQRTSLIVGLVGSALTLIAIIHSPTQFFRSYLFAYAFWIGLPVGCLGILMTHHLTGGGWGIPIRRLAEAGSRTFPIMVILFVPVLFGMTHLYLWADPAAVSSDAILQYKHPYLNPPFYVARTVVYFCIYFVLGFFLNRWSQEQDESGNPILARRLEELSGPGLVLWGIAVTYSSVDWIMSLEPHWFSTIYGMIFMVIAALTALAFMVFFAGKLVESNYLPVSVSIYQWNDLGNLLLTFVILWAYLVFSQFLIIWAGNLKDEIPWYLSRASNGWGAIAVFLFICHFAVPFLLLLSRDVKRRDKALGALAVFLFLVSIADLYWEVVPAFQPNTPRIHVTDFTAFVGIGGLWVAAFVWRLKSRALVALHDTRFEEATEHGD